ncbi:MAG: extracellular solute-binding protein [Pseudomonadota bacterium]
MKKDNRMKRVLILLVLLVTAAALFGAGVKEPMSERYKLTLVNTGDSRWPDSATAEDTGGYVSFQEKIADEFRKTHPNIEVTVIHRDVTQGSLTVDALMAKGTPPDVWLDAAGYFQNYLNADYALPLEQYMDVSVYQKDLTDLYTRNGHVYALASTNVANGMVINNDMLKAIGYTMPAQADWTTDEFLRLAERLKGAGFPATMIMTQQGLISWNMVWLYAFGAELYRNQDYSKVTINTPAAKAGLEYMKLLVDKGYAYPYPNEQNDDAGVELFTTGKVFSCMMQTGHVTYWLPEQLKNNKIDKLIDYSFVEFPHAPGVAHTPTYCYQTAVIAHRSADEGRNKAVIELFKSQVGPDYQRYAAMCNGGFPTIVGLQLWDKGDSASATFKSVAAIAANAGAMDLGGLSPRAAEVNAAWKLPIQAFMAGKLTAQQVLDQFEAEAKKILATK